MDELPGSDADEGKQDFVGMLAELDELSGGSGDIADAQIVADALRTSRGRPMTSKEIDDVNHLIAESSD